MIRTLATMILGLTFFSSAAAEIGHPGGDQYLVLSRDLHRLKDDFNAARDSVRLVFIVGPTCGICLRGMADLNDAFISEMQGDKRLQTFVVHVPTLGATETHVKPAMPLLMGPNIYHYWDQVGIIGRHYSEVLEVSAYAWDVWFAYGPDAEWTGTIPPTPVFWQHQLSPFPDELYLDPEDFARRTMAMVKEMGEIPAPVPASVENPNRGVEIDHVAQSPSRPERTYIHYALGGRRNIRSAISYEMTGNLETAEGTQRLSIAASRPNLIERSASALPKELATKLDAAFDFEGVLYKWRAKDNELDMRGMVKLNGSLAWRIDMTTPEGDDWELLIDSHSGNTLRQRLLSGPGEEYLLEVRYFDFRKTEGISFAHRIEYRDGDDDLIGTEIIETISIHRN